MDESERCMYCGWPVGYGLVVEGEWAHLSGSRYCLDSRGYTATPIQVATPPFHPPGGVL